MAIWESMALGNKGTNRRNGTKKGGNVVAVPLQEPILVTQNNVCSQKKNSFPLDLNRGKRKYGKLRENKRNCK